jgi:hypothetical protein
MTGSSVLPVALHKGELYFLFGKENELEDSAKGYSDFGGGVEKGENILETALREGGEELTGFLGDGRSLQKHMDAHGGHLKMQHDQYHMHLFCLEYDPRLPVYYNQNHAFLWERMDKRLLSQTKLFEKIKIEWFTVPMMKRRRNEFRSFYRDIVDDLIANVPRIKSFVRKCRPSFGTRKKSPRKRLQRKSRSKV